MKQLEKREYKRIDDYLSFTFRVISRQEFDTVKDKYVAGTVGEEGMPPMQERDLTPDELAVWRVLEPVMRSLNQRLSVLNSKLDVVISLLRGEKPRALILQKPRKINISGSGCKFETQKPPPQGSHVEMRIQLPTGGGTIVPALGRVVHVMPAENDRFFMAVRYEAISYEHREQMVQYILKTERALLRAQREKRV